MPVRRLLLSMTSTELSWWMAYERIDPFGNERQDLHAAMICFKMACDNYVKGPKPKMEDWVLDFIKSARRQIEPEKLAEEELIAKVRMINAMLGGEEVDNGDDREPGGEVDG
jgi:hypothetical protein